LALGFCSFAASGFVKWFYYEAIRRKGNLAQQRASLSVDQANSAVQDDIA